MRHLPLVLATVCWAIPSYPASVNAAQITLTQTGAGSGSLDGVPFEWSAFTITAMGDTDNRQASSALGLPDVGFFIEHDAARIAIAGVGTLDFVTNTFTCVNNDVSAVGFSNSDAAVDLLHGPFDSAFAGWDMLTSIGPISGEGRLLQWTYSPVQTDLGILVFDDVDSVPVSFQAVVSSSVIPAPGALLLGTLGASISVGLGRRKML